MNYIVHKRFKHKGISGKEYNFPYGTELSTIGKFIAYDNAAVCYPTSEYGHMYFARNDDGNGLERGKLTYAIAYSDRKPNKNNGFRFTEKEREMLVTEYSHFLIENEDYILFNDRFFNAEIDELRELAKKLGVL